MNEKKNLDRLFQEKFKDFEYEPNEQVWLNIEAALKEKKEDRKIIPFWFRLSGIAAALLIGLFAYNSFFGDSPTSPANGIVNGKEGSKGLRQAPKDAVVNNSDDSGSDTNRNGNDKQQQHGDNPVVNNGNGAAVKSNTINANPSEAVASGSEAAGSTKNNNVPALSNSNNAVVDQSKSKSNAIAGSNKSKTSNNTPNPVATNPGTKGNKNANQKHLNSYNSTQDAVAGTDVTITNKAQAKNSNGLNLTQDAVAVKADNPALDKNNKGVIKTLKTSEDAVAGRETIKDKNPKVLLKGSNNANTQIAAVSGKSKIGNESHTKTAAANNPVGNTTVAATGNDNKKTTNTTDPTSVSKTPLIDTPANAVAITKKEDATIDGKKLDSTAIATVEPNALEELLLQNEKEKLLVAETKLNRWQITSNVAPIYFSSTANGGSPIDREFADNSKSYENNMSFGVGVNYALNKKISIRTGVNKFTLGYNTNDVAFYAGLQSRGLQNVSGSGINSNIQVVSVDAVSDGLLPFENGIQNSNDGYISQRMGYVEVPMEMSYKLVDKKFGITVIGGLSTLFLNENKVSVVSSTMSASLGEANNLNDIHFSSNIGLGFKYSFWKAFEVNFEPMFKYQLNTFTNDVGNFKPYFIGLYSGLSFEF